MKIKHLAHRLHASCHLEVLEHRRLLTVQTTYVNDNWYVDDDLTLYGGQVQPGMIVINLNDSTDPGTITAVYGTQAFGTVTSDGNGPVSPTSRPGAKLIHDAIQGTNFLGGIVNILEGTYAESDIVVDRSLNLIGAGQSGAARTLIVPEVVSSHADVANFGVATHSGIIIYSPDVTVSNLALNGNGNGALIGTLNFHHGVTTLYDTQNGGNYNSLHNGSLAAGLQLGPSAVGQQTIPNLQIDHVTVQNVFYHGITLSAPSGKSYGVSGSTGNQIISCVVNNVGDVKDASRIGILVQNLDSGGHQIDSALHASNGNVLFCTVTGVGVGIESTVFGPTSYGGTAAARNHTGLLNNSVTDAVVQAYHIEFQDNADDITGGSPANRGNVATFSGSNNAVGLYLSHSQPTIEGFTISGAKIGVQVVDSPLASGAFPTIGLGNTITGPGIGVAGSVGVLIENSVAHPDSSYVRLGAGTTISGFATGVKINQALAPGDAQPSVILLDRPALAGNGVGIDAGNGAEVRGDDPSPPLTASGQATIRPGFDNSGYYYNSPGNSGSPVLTAATADVLDTGDLSLSASSTFSPLITGQSGTTLLFNFNSAVNYPSAFPVSPDASGQTSTPYGAPNGWFGSVVQDGSGPLLIGGAATNGHGFDLLFGTNNHSIGGGLYQLDPIDISNRTTLDITAKKSVANQSSVFAIGLMDIRGNINYYSFSFSDLNSSTYTTLRVNLLAPSASVFEESLLGPDHHLDLTKIVGYYVSGDQGTINGNQNIPFGLLVDGIEASSFANSQLNVTGSVNLGSAQLAPTLRAGFSPTLGQQFTIVNNDGAEALTGTFTGLAEGAFTTIGGNSYQITYVGGTGNDVVLVRNAANEAPAIDLDADGGGLGFTTSWSNSGAVNITDADATATDDSGTIALMTATIVGVHAGDVLSATPAGSIVVTYDAFNHVLNMIGNDTVANYQAVLRSIKYNNTSGNPGVSTLAINVVANDGASNSATALAAILINSPPDVDLNGSAAGGIDRTVTWTNGGAVNLADATLALVTDTGNIASMTVTIPVAQTGDSITATGSGGITVSYNAAGQVLNLTGNATPASYQTVLRTVKYNNNVGGPSTGSFNVNVVANDGVSNSNTAVTTVVVQVPPKVDLNGPQIAGGNNYTTTWLDTGAVPIADNIVGIVFNGQAPNLVSMNATLVSPAAGDVLTGTAAGGITVSYDGANGVLRMTGNATATNYQTVLRSIKYNNTSGPVNLTSKTVNVVGFDATSASATATSTITIQPLRLDLNGDLTLGSGYNSFWSNAGAVNITGSTGIPATTLVDGKAANLTSATATIVGVHTGDVLSATAAGGITVSYDAGNHVLNMTGSNTLANYQSVLRSVKYNNTSGTPGVGVITVNFSAVNTLGTISNATSTTQIVLSGSQVVGRYTFYNQSGTSSPVRYDGNTAGISTLDDGAIAFDKAAYIPNGAASTFNNVISYNKGVNGIMIDLAGSHGTIESTDFIFRVGNNNTPGSAGSSWADAPNPASISVRAGAGVGGSDRIEIIWNNGDITKKWLQVVVKTDAGTGLTQLGGYTAGYGDVFYFGHALANSGQGDTATLASTDGTDELEARNHQQTVLQNFSQINTRDYNRDGAVDSADALLARNNQTTGLAGLNPANRYINLAAGSPPNAPEGEQQAGGDENSESVPAAITMGSGDSSAANNSSSDPTSWLADSLTTTGAFSNGVTTAALLELLAEEDSRHGVDEELNEVDLLLVDLGTA